MLYLATILHMHQPYYKDLLTGESSLPWVRLHGVKDYLDMVQILGKYPAIRQTFNIVPSLIEQIEDYCNGTVKDKYLELSLKPVAEMTLDEKKFILENFFSINIERVVALFPRYYELYFKRQKHAQFDDQDLTDIQVLFNLSWIDPSFRGNYPELKRLCLKGRFFDEADKKTVIEAQIRILKDIIPSYRKALESGQVEFIVSPYYHPILPLLYSTNSAKEAEPKTVLPKIPFKHPEDAKEQINSAVMFFNERLGQAPKGMWPSEQSVCEQIAPAIAQAGINWVVTDEAILFKSLKKKKRDAKLIYRPYQIKKNELTLNIIFRDRNLSDLIGFVYHKMTAKAAVEDFMGHLENIAKASKEDTLVTIAMDGENAWEYYPNDGHDFLNLLYSRLSEAKFLKTTTVADYLAKHPPENKLKKLAAGSWIYGNFGKWIGNPVKIKAWEWLTRAREEMGHQVTKPPSHQNALAWKQIHILEGSDWFWWAGEDPDGSFDRLFRRHLSNFYNIIGKEPPEYLSRPLGA